MACDLDEQSAWRQGQGLPLKMVWKVGMWNVGMWLEWLEMCHPRTIFPSCKHMRPFLVAKATTRIFSNFPLLFNEELASESVSVKYVSVNFFLNYFESNIK